MRVRAFDCFAVSKLLTAAGKPCPVALRAKNARSLLLQYRTRDPRNGPMMLTTLSAAAASAGEPPAWMSFLPLVAMGFIFWFLILRPQMRQQKEHKAKIAALKKNDMVVNAGGLVGKVVRIDDHYVELELAPNVKVKAVRSTLGDIIPPAGAAPAND